MKKVLTADKVKKLPVGTDVFLVKDGTDLRGMLWIVKSGRKKFLKGLASKLEIKDMPGWHYEVDA